MKVLMVYYSRSGVTRKATEQIAEVLRQASGAEVEVEEITEDKDRGGFLGGLGAGKDAILKRAVAIEPVKADAAGFDLVAIGTPVWAWTACPPVQTFCRQHGKKAGKVAFYCTMGKLGDKGAFKTMEELCGKAPVATLALIDRHVKKDDPDNHLAKVREFAEQIASAD